MKVKNRDCRASKDVCNNDIQGKFKCNIVVLFFSQHCFYVISLFLFVLSMFVAF